MPDPVHPFPAFSRLRISGRDRAKFLHNFCTNEIKALPPGSACEAFFVDVRARVLAHGYVLCFEDVHEVWLLGQDVSTLFRHLTKYIITEDVTIDPPQTCASVFFRARPELAVLIPEYESAPADSVRCFNNTSPGPSVSDVAFSALRLTWAEEPLLVICAAPETEIHIFRIIAGQSPLSPEEVNSLRIRERFPVIGRDLTSDHLAPEAERNEKAISYNKGCYLGQEPIARLDAMGHVNKALRIVELANSESRSDLEGLPVLASDGTVAGTLTSVSIGADSSCLGLTVLKLTALNQPLQVCPASAAPVSIVAVHK